MDAVGYGIAEFCKCLWHSMAKPISYICNPTKNLKLLEDELQRLVNRSVDVKNIVEIEEVKQGGKRTQQVDGWLKEVQQLEVESLQLIQEGQPYQHIKCLVWCSPSNYRSSYKLGKRVTQLLNDVKERQAEGKFDTLVIRLPPQVYEMPMENTVGLDSMLAQVWKWLQAKDVGIIGLYGMGGVGKTTLLRRINEEFRCTSHGFHVVLWVVVSKQVNLDKIRESIWKNLGIGNDVWNDRTEEARAAELCKVLNKKKFVLLIDDIWERVDMARIGIPFPNPENGSKIMFTTRSEKVCGQMEAKERLKVECLSPKQALELFEAKVGQATLDLHPDIPKYAKEISYECKGLPLALITVGRAMASMKTPDEWSRALRILRNYPPEFSEMVGVYNLLRFSYDGLEPTNKQCFLYCALFPEDYNIGKDHLIDLWIGEGFLGDIDNIWRTRDRGALVVRSLKSACLLERGTNEDQVKMHDVIRDMALWLAREHEEKGNEIIVEEEDVHISRWKEVGRISLHGQEINHVAEVPECSSLVTLLINEAELETLPQGFFNSMQVLRVLDMSGNTWFSKLPTGVRRLVNLQYLNLSGTRIKMLPNEMKYLTSLLYLLLDDTCYLVDIPKEVISSLFSLRVFRKSGEDCYVDERMLVEGLEGLNQLNELSIVVSTAFAVQKLLKSPNLQRSITHLTINRCSDLTAIQIPSSSLRKISCLNRLEIYGCDSLMNIEICEDSGSMIPRHVNGCLSRGLELTNLQHVNIRGSKLRNLSWLIYAPNLQTLHVRDCETLEKIFDEDIVQHIDENASARLFSSLTTLILHDLPKLRSIHNRTSSSPLLTWIRIWECPSLKKLPFDSNSRKNSLIEVRAQCGWWSELEWDDEATAAFFSSKLYCWFP